MTINCKKAGWIDVSKRDNSIYVLHTRDFKINEMRNLSNVITDDKKYDA